MKPIHLNVKSGNSGVLNFQGVYEKPLKCQTKNGSEIIVEKIAVVNNLGTNILINNSLASNCQMVCQFIQNDTPNMLNYLSEENNDDDHTESSDDYDSKVDEIKIMMTVLLTKRAMKITKMRLIQANAKPFNRRVN